MQIGIRKQTKVINMIKTTNVTFSTPQCSILEYFSMCLELEGEYLVSNSQLLSFDVALYQHIGQ